MKRLTHTPQGFTRYMQMSRNGLFIFVEGKQSDRFFYSRLCGPICSKHTVEYETVTADEMSGRGGGKEQLARFFRVLEGSNSLVSNFKGKKTTVLFFLDKDIDDILNKKINSPHLMYTPTYDVESLIFQEGDIVNQSAALAGLDPADVRQQIADPESWRLACAECWKEWIIICIFCKRHKVKHCPNFGSFSQINAGGSGTPTGPVDNGKLSSFLTKLQSGTNFDGITFKRKYGCVKRLVKFVFSQNRHSLIFKGKWYLPFLREAVHKGAAGRMYDRKAVDAGIIGALSANIDFTEAWAKPLADATETVLSFIA